MTPLRVATIVEYNAFIRQPVSLFWTFIYPIILLVILAFVFGGSRDMTLSIHAKDSVAQARMDDAAGLLTDSGWVVQRVKETEEADAVISSTVDGQVQVSGTASVEAMSALRIALAAEKKAVGRTLPQLSAIKGQNQSNYKLFLVSGVVALSVVSLALFGFTPILVANRAAGRMKWLAYWPLGKLRYLVAFTLARAVVIVVFSMVMLYGFGWFYSAHSIWNLSAALALLVTLITGAFAFLALGLLLASVLTKPTTTAAVVNLLNLPIMFLSDMVVPLSILPDAIANVARLSPIYLFVDVMRNVFENGAAALTVRDLAIWIGLTAIGVVAYIVSARLLKISDDG